jgi:small subunit ribosomal protein S16
VVKIRLMRVGKRKQPYYRVVVADARSPRDGRFIENIGRYHPRQHPSLIEIDPDRALHWLQNGAQPSDPVRVLLEKTGIWGQFTGKGPTEPMAPPPEKATPSKKAAAAAAEQAAAEEPAEEAPAAEAAAPEAPAPEEPASTEPAATEPAATEEAEAEVEASVEMPEGEPTETPAAEPAEEPAAEAEPTEAEEKTEE